MPIVRLLPVVSVVRIVIVVAAAAVIPVVSVVAIMSRPVSVSPASSNFPYEVSRLVEIT